MVRVSTRRPVSRREGNRSLTRSTPPSLAATLEAEGLVAVLLLGLGGCCQPANVTAPTPVGIGGDIDTVGALHGTEGKLGLRQAQALVPAAELARR